MTKPKHTRPENNRDSQVISIICGVIFAVFCVLYLHLLQPDLIGLEQHRASSGQTVYNPLVGTIILSTLLTLTGFLLHDQTPSEGISSIMDAVLLSSTYTYLYAF